MSPETILNKIAEKNRKNAYNTVKRWFIEMLQLVINNKNK